MAPPEKVTANQKVHLINLMDSYFETKKNRGFTKFWANVYEGWFKLWPEQEDMSLKDTNERREALTNNTKARQKTEKAYNNETPKFKKEFKALYAKILADGIESIEGHFNAFTHATDTSSYHGQNIFGQAFSLYDLNFMNIHMLAFMSGATYHVVQAPAECKEQGLGSQPSVGPSPASPSHASPPPPPLSLPPPPSPPSTIVKPPVIKKVVKKLTLMQSPIVADPALVIGLAQTEPLILSPMPTFPAAHVNNIFLDPTGVDNDTTAFHATPAHPSGHFNPTTDTSMWEGFNIEAALNAMCSAPGTLNAPAVYPSLTQKLTVPLHDDFFLHSKLALGNMLYMFPTAPPVTAPVVASTITSITAPTVAPAPTPPAATTLDGNETKQKQKQGG
ncbi:hypothetical protein BDN71DRAFT_1433935 [Pleurotus eryngii]|uniref:Uncharacterized protein n=1 Tax=Pleurotus eryngii TaxID=5323 RepID=A0A9P5ZNE2_PLEER|nr:hypothetical protein BDN71DRAFT_1433935 [Pleurotus eryngii]